MKHLPLIAVLGSITTVAAQRPILADDFILTPIFLFLLLTAALLGGILPLQSVL